MQPRKYTIYLVEDEEPLADVLEAYLVKEGWEVTVFRDGESALAFNGPFPHLWILDIMLPGMDGYELLRKIKEKADVPVIFTSARDQDLDRIRGLELGSDDYLAKPFLPRELLIRVKKLLTRVYETSNEQLKPVKISDYDIFIYGKKIIYQGVQVELTTKEMDVVLFLVKNLGETKSRLEILDEVWGEDYVGTERAVDDVIRRIRKKMPRLSLETMYGGGYRVVRS